MGKRTSAKKCANLQKLSLPQNHSYIQPTIRDLNGRPIGEWVASYALPPRPMKTPQKGVPLVAVTLAEAEENPKTNEPVIVWREGMEDRRPLPHEVRNVTVFVPFNYVSLCAKRVLFLYKGTYGNGQHEVMGMTARGKPWADPKKFEYFSSPVSLPPGVTADIREYIIHAIELNGIVSWDAGLLRQNLNKSRSKDSKNGGITDDFHSAFDDANDTTYAPSSEDGEEKMEKGSYLEKARRKIHRGKIVMQRFLPPLEYAQSAIEVKGCAARRKAVQEQRQKRDLTSASSSSSDSSSSDESGSSNESSGSHSSSGSSNSDSSVADSSSETETGTGKVPKENRKHDRKKKRKRKTKQRTRERTSSSERLSKKGSRVSPEGEDDDPEISCDPRAVQSTASPALLKPCASSMAPKCQLADSMGALNCITQRLPPKLIPITSGRGDNLSRKGVLAISSRSQGSADQGDEDQAVHVSETPPEEASMTELTEMAPFSPSSEPFRFSDDDYQAEPASSPSSKGNKTANGGSSSLPEDDSDGRYLRPEAVCSPKDAVRDSLSPGRQENPLMSGMPSNPELLLGNAQEEERPRTGGKKRKKKKKKAQERHDTNGNSPSQHERSRISQSRISNEDENINPARLSVTKRQGSHQRQCDALEENRKSTGKGSATPKSGPQRYRPSVLSESNVRPGQASSSKHATPNGYAEERTPSAAIRNLQPRRAGSGVGGRSQDLGTKFTVSGTANKGGEKGSAGPCSFTTPSTHGALPAAARSLPLSSVTPSTTTVSGPRPADLTTFLRIIQMSAELQKHPSYIAPSDLQQASREELLASYAYAANANLALSQGILGGLYHLIMKDIPEPPPPFPLPENELTLPVTKFRQLIALNYKLEKPELFQAFVDYLAYQTWPTYRQRPRKTLSCASVLFKLLVHENDLLPSLKKNDPHNVALFRIGKIWTNEDYEDYRRPDEMKESDTDVSEPERDPGTGRIRMVKVRYKKYWGHLAMFNKLIFATLDKIWFKNQVTLKEAGILSKDIWDKQHSHLTGYLRHKKFNEKASNKKKRKRCRRSSSPRWDGHNSDQLEEEESTAGRIPPAGRAGQSSTAASSSRQKEKAPKRGR